EDSRLEWQISMARIPRWTIDEATNRLQSDNPKDRYFAVNALMAVGPWAFLNKCGKYLDDPSWEVRGLTLHYFYDVLMDNKMRPQEGMQEWASAIAPRVVPLVSDPVGPV